MRSISACRPYTTGCNLLLVKISFTVLVLDWTDVMVQLAIELGDFTFGAAFKAIDDDLEILGKILDVVVSPIKAGIRLHSSIFLLQLVYSFWYEYQYPKVGTFCGMSNHTQNLGGFSQ